MHRCMKHLTKRDLPSPPHKLPSYHDDRLLTITQPLTGLLGRVYEPFVAARTPSTELRGEEARQEALAQ